MIKYTIQKYLDELKKYDLVLDSFISLSTDIDYLSYNSNDIENNTLFVCKGSAFKEKYLEDVIATQKVLAYISEKKYNVNSVDYIIVKDIRKAMPIIANIFYNEAWKQLNLIGITGTKGKSTTAYYVKYILDEYLSKLNKAESAILSSIDNYDGKIREESHLTTPEALDLHKHFYNVVSSQIEYLTMEVSSQALKYDRVNNIIFDVGVFLNISEDHISPLEHKDFDDYFNSKLELFSQCNTAIVNIDADYCEKILEASKNSKSVLTFSIKNPNADIYGYDIRKDNNNILFKVRTNSFDKDFKLTMPGLFNVENALASIGVGIALGIDYNYIYRGLEKARSSGRMELYSTKDNNIIAIVDYAHNKLSFEKLFSSVAEEYPNRQIISIFGCPGLKALGRRKDLGTIAGKYSHKVYIVAEDPGYEPVEDISKDIAQYVEEQDCEYVMIEDRGEAIKDAIITSNNSIILITGKGNETRQKYGSQYIPCLSDVEYTKKYLEQYDVEHRE